MSLSPVMDSPCDSMGISEIRINLNENFSNLFEPKKEAESENMPVFIRIRPMLPQENNFNNCLTIPEESSVRCIAPVDSAKYRNFQDKIQDFTFSHAYGPEVSQLAFFEETMNSTIKSFMEGQNTLVFAYGSSGSGKTYTMLGDEKEPGVIPLSVHLLFQCLQGMQLEHVPFKPHMACEVAYLDASKLVEQSLEKEKLLTSQNEDSDSTRMTSLSVSCLDDMTRISGSVLSLQDLSSYPSYTDLESSCRGVLELQGELKYSVWISFFEVYNEQIFDLLKPFTKKKRQTLSLGEDHSGNIFVKGVKEVRVCSSSEVLKLLRLGKRNLKIATTKLNYQSSRSHCIFNIKIIRTPDSRDPSKVFINSLSFCDLAGSERCGKTQNTGMRLKEASNINTSLMILGRCIEMLRQNQMLRDKRLIPFRESKLTRLFSGFFTGKGRASMIVNVSPSSHTFDETLNALKFSALAQQVTMKDSHLSKELSRLTEKLQCDTLSNSINNRDSMDDEFDYSMALDERDELIKQLMEVAQSLEAELHKEKQEKAELEPEIRSRIKQEFLEEYIKMDKYYKKRIERMQKYTAKRADRRIESALKSLCCNENRDDSGSDDDDESGGDSDVSMETESDQNNVNDSGSTIENNNANDKDHFKQKNKTLHTALDMVEQKLHDFQELVNFQETQLNDKDTALCETNTLLLCREEKILELEQKMAELQKTVSDLEEKLIIRENDGDSQQDRTDKFAELPKDSSGRQNQMNVEVLHETEALLAVREEELSEMGQKAVELQEIITSLQNQLEEKERTINETEVLLESREEEWSSMKQQMTELQETVSLLMDQLKDQETILEEAKGNLSTTAQELFDEQRKTTELNGKLCALEIELKFQAELIKDNKVEGNSSSVNAEVNQVQEAIFTKLKADLSTKADDLARKEQEIVELRENISSMTEQLKTQESDLNDAKATLLSTNNDLIEEQGRTAELLQKISSMENEMEAKAVSTESTDAFSQTESEYVDEKITELQETIISLENQLKEKENTLLEIQENLSSKSSEVSKMAAEKVATEKLLSSQNDELSALTLKVAELLESINIKEMQFEEKSEKLEEVQESLSAKCEELRKIEIRNTELKNSIKLKDEELKKINDLAEDYKNSSVLYGEQISSLKQVVSEFEEKLKTGNSTISKLKDLASKSADILLEKDAEITQLTEKVSQLETSKETQLNLQESAEESSKEDETDLPNGASNAKKSKRKSKLSQDDVAFNEKKSTLQECPSTIIELLQKIEHKAWENANHLKTENTALKEQIAQHVCNIDSVKSDIPEEWEKLLLLLQKIEIVATQNYEDWTNVCEGRIEQISELVEKNTELSACQIKMDSKFKNMERMLKEKESSIKDLEKALRDQKQVEKSELAANKRKHEEEIKNIMEKKTFPEKPNRTLKFNTGPTKTKSENVEKLPVTKTKPNRAKKPKTSNSFEHSNDNSVDADFEPKRPSRTARSSRLRSNATITEEKEPKRPQRQTRATRQKNTKMPVEEEEEDEEDVIEIPVETDSHENGFSKPSSDEVPKKKRTVPESPLEKIKHFVADAVPKIKSAAQSLLSSPAVSRRADVSANTGMRRKRKLFTDDQPMLREVSPVEKKLREPAEKKTRGRPPKKQYK